MVKIGYGKEIVTPPIGSGMIGYFEDRISKGVKDDLYARSLCLNDKDNCVFVVSSDFCWIEPSVVEKVKKMISEKLKIKKPNLVIHATHTHTGPLTGFNKDIIYTEKIKVDEKYIENLPSMIFKAIEQSYRSLQNVFVGFGSCNVSGISFIRRYKMKNGMVITNPVDRTQIVEPSGEIDQTLNIMKIVDEKNRLIGVAMNFPLHPDTIGGDLISGDWPGVLVEKVSKEFHCEAIFFNGAAGDINHINPFDSQTRSSQITEKIASTIFDSVRNMLPGIKCFSINNIVFSQDVFKLPKRKISEKDIEQAKKDIEKYSPSNLRYMVANALLMQARIKGDTIDNPVALLTLDNKMGAFFLSGELFSSIGLKIKNIMDVEYKWIIENCNGFAGYIPDEEAFAAAKENKRIRGEEFPDVNVLESIGMEASYETSPISCRVAPEAEKELISQFKKLWSRHRTMNSG